MTLAPRKYLKNIFLPKTSQKIFLIILASWSKFIWELVCLKRSSCFIRYTIFSQLINFIFNSKFRPTQTNVPFALYGVSDFSIISLFVRQGLQGVNLYIKLSNFIFISLKIFEKLDNEFNFFYFPKCWLSGTFHVF